ncbi:MAG TPA: hypothetical protein VHV49_15355 [Pseudonocardiaceae bacterium]|nr:hypothetical protein [Pseudonocardiaceae bacterium]
MTVLMAGINTNNWNTFYSSWLEPALFGVAISVLTLIALMAISGLLTPFLVTPSAEAWPRWEYQLWLTLGIGCLLAVAVFLPVYPVFHPFGAGSWLFWAYPWGVALPGLALLVVTSLRFRGVPVLPVPACGVLAAIWVVLICWFYTWGAGQQLLVAAVSLGLLGLTATTISLGQNKRLQVEARSADGKVDSAATDYLLCRLQSLGSRPPEALSFSQATDLSQLVSQDLSAIPDGAIASAVARVMYAIRPGLTWRARITQVDSDRLTVQLSRNGRQVENAVISRPDLNLPGIPPGTTEPALTDRQNRSKAQLLTGAAACVLVRLSRVHPELRPGLCGATEWKSVTLHVVATEPALAESPDVNIRLLRESVNADQHYALGRLDYLAERYQQTTPKTPAVRRRFAGLLDAQLKYTHPGKSAKNDPYPGYEVMYLRILYSTTAIRLNNCVLALIGCDQNRDRFRELHGPEAEAVRDRAKLLVRQCERLGERQQGRDEHVWKYADHLRPMAVNLRDVARYLATGETGTDPAHEYRTPKIAVHTAARAGVVAEFASPSADRFAAVIDQLSFGVATPADFGKVIDDPSFWLSELRKAVATDVPGFGLDMLGLAVFSPYAQALRMAGITTFQQFRSRTANPAQQQDLATDLSARPAIIAHLAEIAELATSRPELADADVLAVFIGAGITSTGELTRRMSDGATPDLIEVLRATAAQQGRASLDRIRKLELWLPDVTTPSAQANGATAPR